MELILSFNRHVHFNETEAFELHVNNIQMQATFEKNIHHIFFTVFISLELYSSLSLDIRRFVVRIKKSGSIN